MDPLSLSSGYLPFSTLLQRNPSFFWVRSQFWKFLGNNSGNIGPIKLKLWPQLLLICIYLPYYAFKKVKFLRPQDVLKDCFFGPTFAPIYPMKKSKIEKVYKYFPGKYLSIGLSKYPKIWALSGLNFELKIQLLFAVFIFFWQIWTRKSKIKRSEVRLAQLFESPWMWCNFWSKNLGRSWWQSRVITALVSFFLCLFQEPLFWLWAHFWCHALNVEKEQFNVVKQNFMTDILKKKFFKNLQEQISSVDPRAIRSHLISFRFLPFSRHFRTVPEHQKSLMGSRKIWFNRGKKSGEYLKG